MGPYSEVIPCVWWSDLTGHMAIRDIDDTKP